MNKFKKWLYGLFADSIDIAEKFDDIKPKLPIKGEHWCIDNGDPFPPKVTIEILDVLDGWVRYRIGRSCHNSDERSSIERFIRICRFHSKSENLVK